MRKTTVALLAALITIVPAFGLFCAIDWDMTTQGKGRLFGCDFNLRPLLIKLYRIEPSYAEAIQQERAQLKEPFKSRYNALEESASRLASATKVGINFQRFGDSLRELQGTYDLAVAAWPANTLKSERRTLEEIVDDYATLGQVWQAKIFKNKSGIPLNELPESIKKRFASDTLMIAEKTESGQLILPANDDTISMLMSDAQLKVQLVLR